jgi:hypothetical protein
MPDSENDVPSSPEGRFQQEIRDAVELMEFAIETGRNIDDNIIDRITKAQSYLHEALKWPTDTERANFEKAYRDLAKATDPVNIRTLRATEDGKPGPSRGRLSRYVFSKSSDAKVYSKQLWVWAIACALVIVFSQVLGQTYAPDEETASSGMSRFIAFTKPLLPFLNGLLGALTYLMRSAHGYIAERSFDLKRVPEYYNRMLLGFVGGGVILLFVDPKSFNVGDGAIAFIVGYNTDYLFDTLERVAGAIFPKVDSIASRKGGTVDSKFGVAKVAVSNDELEPGGRGTATVTLTAPAPSGGVVVALSADHAITIPQTVTIQTGATSAQFTFSVPPEAAEGAASITATASGTSASASIQIRPALVVESVSAQKGNDNAISGTVVLNREAATDDVKVTTESDQTWCRLATTTLNVPKATKQAAFTAALNAGSTGTVTFTASLGKSQAKGSVTI